MLKYLPLILCALISFNVSAETNIPKQYLPVDSDNDGVLDENDECYKTEPGAIVDEKGCYVLVIDTKQLRLNINFDFDSSFVKQEYYKEIEPVATFMVANPYSRVVIEGHADSDGSNEYNKRLSQRRATAVSKVLISHYNIAPARVAAVGFGEERPLVPNDTEENKAINRRVVAVISITEEKRAE